MPLAFWVSHRVSGELHTVVDEAAAIGGDGPQPEPQAMRIAETADLMASLRLARTRVRASAAAKDEFLAVLGHELRNPLSPIANVLEILDRKGEAGTARERQILRRQVRHMTRLVDDLLDVSRLVRGKVSIQPERVDLGHLAREMLEHDPQLARGLELQVRDEPLEASADPVRIRQVLVNLLANAHRHAMDRPVRLALSRRGDGMVEIEVRDEGAGMTVETQTRLFEPFYQAASQPGSLGLGMTIASRIVELHGGTLSARSAGPGQGSTFTVLLPG